MLHVDCNNGEKIWCVPTTYTYEDMANEFVDFLKRHPEYVTNDTYAEVSVHSFFSDVFNCNG